MKDLTRSVIVVLLIALGLAISFHSLYPRVELTTELYALFVFVAVVLERVLTKLWSLWTKRTPAQTETDK